jgi:hypothetical protein
MPLSHRHLGRAAAIFATAVAVLVDSTAQTAITAITTVTSDLADGVANGATYQNTTVAITGFSTATTTYSVGGTAISAFIRRNNVNANNSSSWYAQGTPTTQFRAPYATSYDSLLLGNNILRGSDNTFTNTPAGASAGNIERLDFILSNSGVAATADMAFAVFDRGLAGLTAHDSVKIALITSLGSITVNSVTYTNAPTNYGGNLVTIAPANYGATNPVANFTYNLFRSANGDNLATSAMEATPGTQGLAGSVVNLSDFNVPPGTIIYGYSLFSNDVTNGGSMANLANWSNATYYPTTGGSGADLAAVNGVQFRNNAPEPATYGAMLMAAGIGLVVCRRWRRPNASRRE